MSKSPDAATKALATFAAPRAGSMKLTMEGSLWVAEHRQGCVTIRILSDSMAEAIRLMAQTIGTWGIPEKDNG